MCVCVCVYVEDKEYIIIINSSKDPRENVIHNSRLITALDEFAAAYLPQSREEYQIPRRIDSRRTSNASLAST